MIDCHIHTNTSVDCNMTIRNACKQAIKVGLKYICFTNHHEIIYVKNNTFDYSFTDEKLSAYKKGIQEARKEFPQLNIGMGTEVGHNEEYKNEIKEFLKTHEFDFILGSVHWITMPDGKRRDLTGEKMISTFKEYPKDKIMRIYTEAIVKAIKSGLYDSIAHIGVMTRFIPGFNFGDYEKELNDIVSAFGESKTGIGLNTNSGRFPLGFWNPAEELLKKVKNSGNKVLTVGSDSHDEASIGKGIKNALKLAKTCGYDKIAFFKNRKPLFIDIK